MSTYEQNNHEEIFYLKTTLNFIKKQLTNEEFDLKHRRSNVIASRKEMWNESVHFSDDFDRIPEMTQYLSEVNSQTQSYESTLKRIERYNQLLASPYFGRFDFKEEDDDEPEKIYIGLYNLMDNDTNSILVYDWRSPISSIFYQYEVGKGSYKSPVGMIYGNILMKRQYKILNSKLKYFFDSSITINDEILQQVLSNNSSAKMKNIVQTIQKEQDIIIRDTENELLIVQGVAGSGKTSIALHRIAFLLYIGMDSKISSNNVIIISPNFIFSKYISGVLPELGEENVKQITFDDIAKNILGNRFILQSRNDELESLIISSHSEYCNFKMQNIKFKGSEIFVQILDRLIKYYEYKLIDFKDIYYDGKVIETKQAIKNQFLKNDIGSSITKRLQRIENIILDKIHPLRKIRLKKIQDIVQNSVGHELEVKSFSRLLSIKESKVFMKYLHSFTKVDYMDVYKLLFNNENLFFKLSQGLELPNNIREILLETKNSLAKGCVSYEDCTALIYIKLKLEGTKEFSDIKQLVIDEAQDYYPLQYEVFKLLFNRAKYTVLGDFNQTLEKTGDKALYDNIEKVLHKTKSTKVFLNKSYRSSIEINCFAQKLLNNNTDFVSFERHEADPKIIFRDNEMSLYDAIAQDINYYYEKGYENIAVLCKTQKESEKVKENLKNITNHKICTVEDYEMKNGVLILPSYMAKGLEFDVVLVYNPSKDNYNNEFDKKLLYIACTRALHQLIFYCTGEKSEFI